MEEVDPDIVAQIASHAADARYTTTVLFYAPWCPHCQHFAPKYEAVGEHFAGDSRVRVTAMDCVAHNKACSGTHKVKGFPTMKVFHALGEPGSLTEEGFVIKAGALAKGTEGIIEWIEQHFEAPPPLLLAPPPGGGGPPPPSQTEPGETRYAPPMGAKAGGAQHSWGGLARAAAPAVSGHALAEGAHAHEPLRPSVMLAHSGRRWDPHTSPVAPGGGGTPARLRLGDAAASLLFGLHYGVFVEGPVLGEGQRAALGDFLGVLARAFPGPASNRAALATLRSRVLGSSGGGSAEGGAKGGAKSGAPLSTDAEWLALLGSFRLQGRVSTAEDLDWTANCDPSKRVAGPLEDPSGAARGAGAGRHITVGYTCGLWTLFHMVTLAAPQAGLTPREATGAIRNYVEHFFGCAHCRDHFLQLFDACDFGRCEVDQDAAPPEGGIALLMAGGGGDDDKSGGGGNSPSEAFRASAEAFTAAHRATALWLWRAHNEVNRRVAAEALEDEAASAAAREAREAGASGGASGLAGVRVVDLDPSWALWPPPDACPACWLQGAPLGAAAAAAAAAGGDRGGDAKGQGRGFTAAEWDEDAVLGFLEKAYDVGLWERGPGGSAAASPGVMAQAEASRDRLVGIALEWSR